MKHPLQLLLPCLILGSCQNAWLTPPPASDDHALFDALWSDIDAHYVFFDQKPVDWDEVYTTHANQITEGMTEEELFALFSNALRQLQDGHVALYAGFNTYLYHELYLNFDSNYDPGVVERNYLDRKINSIGPFTYGILPNEVGYLRYSSFGDDFTAEELTYLLDYFAGTTRLIIDIRDNLGGAADNVTSLMSLFVNSTTTVGEVHMPNGTSQLLASPIRIYPREDGRQYTNPVYILTNRKCYSSGNIFPAFMSQLPQVTLVGDTTGGGSGLARAGDLANGWKYRFSAAKITLVDGTEVENGMAPDVVATTGPSDAGIGLDQILEAALSQ